MNLQFSCFVIRNPLHSFQRTYYCSASAHAPYPVNAYSIVVLPLFLSNLAFFNFELLSYYKILRSMKKVLL